jgi:hypothetical protein
LDAATLARRDKLNVAGKRPGRQVNGAVNCAIEGDKIAVDPAALAHSRMKKKPVLLA